MARDGATAHDVLNTCGADASLDGAACADATLPRGSERARECAEINSALTAEYEALQACETASECGTPLRTVGSCGCTRDAVGRKDADVSRLQQLLARREQLSDVTACEPLGGPCDCPAVDGFACIERRCSWRFVDLR